MTFCTVGGFVAECSPHYWIQGSQRICGLAHVVVHGFRLFCLVTGLVRFLSTRCIEDGVRDAFKVARASCDRLSTRVTATGKTRSETCSELNEAKSQLTSLNAVRFSLVHVPVGPAIQLLHRSGHDVTRERYDEEQSGWHIGMYLLDLRRRHHVWVHYTVKGKSTLSE